VKALHGGMIQTARQGIMRLFKEGKIDVLIATDVASRGLDVEAVDLVVHTAPPHDSETYVHRTGRTGRAGRSGVSVTLYSSPDTERLALLESELNIKFDRVHPSSPTELVKAADEYAVRKEKMLASRMSEKRNLNLQPVLSVGDSDPYVVVFREDIGNWATLSESVSIDANNILREKLRVEKETGVLSDMSSEDRERALLLEARSARKKDKRLLYAAQQREEKERTRILMSGTASVAS
jgi:superfamily II DNA/RNA helicase